MAITDPFFERSTAGFSRSKQLLGGRFHFASSSAALLELVDSAYGGLPEHRFSAHCPDLYVELRLSQDSSPTPAGERPPVMMQSGAGVLCGVMDAANYAVLTPGQHRALVVASEQMLADPYHLRYELIEFAVFVLASRALGLVPLHGACVGRNGRGVLLLGASGAGKSTLGLCCLQQGLDFLAEDAVFVEPRSLRATGVANYLHLQADVLRYVDDAAARRWISAAPLIRRRSGVQKSEVDLRQGPGSLAATPIAVASVVFLSSEAPREPNELLSAIPTEALAGRLEADQPYAAGQPGWRQFLEQIRPLGAFELRRAAHPRAAVDVLQRLLD